jgi:hypothetical protein
VNRERPAFVIVHPDDVPTASSHPRRGRRLREALDMLAAGPLPDVDFAADMEAVLSDVGGAPDDPWAHS